MKCENCKRDIREFEVPFIFADRHIICCDCLDRTLKLKKRKYQDPFASTRLIFLVLGGAAMFVVPQAAPVLLVAWIAIGVAGVIHKAHWKRHS